ncbi:hypothetical protein BD560DRAFT_382764 [Blakeslea trispora]|nr:hypothetical protein BD560DRAFT_382764 [Blakeslea trispora]
MLLQKKITRWENKIHPLYLHTRKLCLCYFRKKEINEFSSIILSKVLIAISCHDFIGALYFSGQLFLFCFWLQT